MWRLSISIFLLASVPGLSVAHDTGVPHEIELTIYDDGRSCPSGCDAHVVMAASLNGTAHAFDPASDAGNPLKCRWGKACQICFVDKDPSSCMTAIYRGSGPPKEKFDFTPAFYAAYCGKSGIPSALRKQCSRMEKAVQKKGYDKRINCFLAPADSKCVTIMSSAQKSFDADLPEWQACTTEGQKAYNARQKNDKSRRIYDCAYSKLSLGGPNSNGDRWKKLLPAACRPGTFVGRNGLDCCNGDLNAAAALHPECSEFHPKP